MLLSLYRFDADEDSTNEANVLQEWGNDGSDGGTVFVLRRTVKRWCREICNSLYNYETKKRHEKQKGGMTTMKKLISMVMAAAMVTSLVPATAFAANGVDLKATAKVVGASNYTVEELKKTDKEVTDAELQLKINTADFTTGYNDKVKFTVTLDNANFKGAEPSVTVKDYYGTEKAGIAKVTTASSEFNGDGTDEVEIELTNDYTSTADTTKYLQTDDVITVSLKSKMDAASKGKTAKVSVSSDDFKIDGGSDVVYATVEGKGLSASTKKLTDIAVEEISTLQDVKLKATVGKMNNIFAAADLGQMGQKSKGEIKLKLSSGFEFVEKNGATATLEDGKGGSVTLDKTTTDIDGEEMIIDFDKLGNLVAKLADTDTWTFKGLNVEAANAKAGATATLKIYVTGNDTVSVEVAKAIDSAVTMSVDKDADLPVIYSGVNVKNEGITDSSDHESLEVTIKESFPGAWNNSKDFTLTLPKGVYLASDVDVTSSNMDKNGATVNKTWFEAAYRKGDFEKLTFAKRTWDETDPKDTKKAELNFKLTLVADPNFEGDVTLKLEGDAVETQEVKIAKFVKPYVVKAEQNDLKIDYRQTKIPTNVTITEAEAGLWNKNATFEIAMEKISFDDDAKVTVDEKSGLSVKNVKTNGGVIKFDVDSRSDDKPATITISDMTLFMDRSLPAGAYDLKVVSSTMNGAVNKDDATKSTAYLGQAILGADKDNKIINDINEDFYSDTAKAGFVNIVTGGREDADSFTTKVVVPVGEKYLLSGETKVELDVAAYINAGNYTMLPIRAVAKALGIPNENVVWNGEARTATVMYGSKVITMTVGQKTMYINGAPVPTSSAVEIKEEGGVGRAFLPMRDLGVALGVADITWDAATRTATLNGSK